MIPITSSVIESGLANTTHVLIKPCTV